MNCSFKPTGESDGRGWKKMACQRCEFITGFTPHPPELVFRKCKPGLGDYVAAAIEVSGIGPAYRWLRGGKCMPCKKRQAALNEAGKKLGI